MQYFTTDPTVVSSIVESVDLQQEVLTLESYWKPVLPVRDRQMAKLSIAVENLNLKSLFSSVVLSGNSIFKSAVSPSPLSERPGKETRFFWDYGHGEFEAE